MISLGHLTIAALLSIAHAGHAPAPAVPGAIQPDAEQPDRRINRLAGNLHLAVPVGRYVGPTDQRGHLLHARQMIRQGTLGAESEITIPIYAFDSTDPLADEPCPLIWPVISLNGSPILHAAVEAVSPVRLGHRTTTLGLVVSVLDLRFPLAPGDRPGVPPSPAINHYYFDWRGVCHADADRSGTLDSDDLIAMDAWFAARPSDPRADFDRDGAISPDDAIDFLTAFALGCEEHGSLEQSRPLGCGCEATEP